MPVRIEPGAEPIPGYTLIERLGGGGFGEVWKAEAPGGLFKAIKFVYGDLQAADDAEGARAEQELKAMSRVKTVHHPYILSLERFDIIDGQLIIVMELADKTLWDRFKECRNQGLPGIPREELLSYVQETAEALDLMNNTYQLQHLDIKPQNLFLVFNHVKVADFGLVKDLGELSAATVTGGVTPVYAAPETFDGWLSRFSDQYSLAIVYQELLTGQRPFTGGTMRQLVLQHLQGEPDLSTLPINDRPAIGRSLAKNPDERFPCCLDLVRALKQASVSVNGVTATFNPKAPPPPRDGKSDATVTPGVTDDGEQTQGSPRGKPRSASELDVGNSRLMAPGSGRPQVLPPRPGTKARRNDVSLDTPPPDGGQTGNLRPSTFGPRPRIETMPVSTEGVGILRPALVIGLGRLGMETLRVFRKQLTQEFGTEDPLPHLRLLGVDTDAEAIHAVAQGDAESALKQSELALAKIHRPSHYSKPRDATNALDDWLNPKVLYRMPRGQSSVGVRPLGRLAFVDNYKMLVRRLEIELETCCNEDTMRQLSNHTELGMRTRAPRVYIVAALSGATGSGMMIDFAYVVRNLLKRFGQSNAEVIGLLYMPSVAGDASRASELANSYAALTELDEFTSGRIAFNANYELVDGRTVTVQETCAPFHRCVALPLPAKVGTVTDLPVVVTRAGEFLYRDLATPLGRAADQQRQRQLQPKEAIGQAVFQNFGSYRLLWPRRQLLRQASHGLCQRLVERWMSKNAGPIVDEVRIWSQEQWECNGLRPENLITRHQEGCEKILEQAPERMFQGIINPLVGALSPGGRGATSPATMNMAPVAQIMDQLERWLGIPEECRPASPIGPDIGHIEKTLYDVAATISTECEHQLTKLVVCLIEAPLYRLAGAEEALRQFCLLVDQALQTQEQLAKELHERSVLLYMRIQALLEGPVTSNVTQTSPLWKGPFGRRSAQSNSQQLIAELLEVLKAYPKVRYQSLILAHLSRLYVGLRGGLSDQLREVGFCRQRLGELQGFLQDKPSATLPGKKTKNERFLLPAKCETLEEAVKKFQQGISLDDLGSFDERVQAIIEKDYHALVQVCMGPSNVVRNLAPAMLNNAAKFLESRLEGESVAEMFLKRYHCDDNALDTKDELKRILEEAYPEMGKTADANEAILVTVPNDEAGQRLQALIKEIEPSACIVPTIRNDEVVFYRELVQIPASDLDQMGPAAQEAFRQKEMLDPGTLHIREDLFAPRAAT